MRSKGSKNKPISLKIPLFSGTTFFQDLNISISIIASEVITSTLPVSNSSRSKLATLGNKILRGRFFRVMQLFDINLAKLKQPNVRKGVTSWTVAIVSSRLSKELRQLSMWNLFKTALPICTLNYSQSSKAAFLRTQFKKHQLK